MKTTNELNINLREATEADRVTLNNLQYLYDHDMSVYAQDGDGNVLANGLFDNEIVNIFYALDEETRKIFLIECNQAIAGFVLLAKSPHTDGTDYYINDFFILNRFKGKGIGKTAVKQIFESYPGTYGVSQLINNQPAICFWKKVLDENNLDYQEKQWTAEDGNKCLCQEFTVPKS